MSALENAIRISRDSVDLGDSTVFKLSGPGPNNGVLKGLKVCFRDRLLADATLDMTDVCGKQFDFKATVAPLVTKVCAAAR